MAMLALVYCLLYAMMDYNNKLLHTLYLVGLKIIL